MSCSGAGDLIGPAQVSRSGAGDLVGPAQVICSDADKNNVGDLPERTPPGPERGESFSPDNAHVQS